MQQEYRCSKDGTPLINGREYDSVFSPATSTDPLKPWQYSPLFSTNLPSSSYYSSGGGYCPVVPPPPADPWGHYRFPQPQHAPYPSYRSYSLERLNQPTGYSVATSSGGCPVVYSLRSPNPSPVHTPSGSPVLNRSRFTPSPGSSPSISRSVCNSRRMLPPSPPSLPPSKGTASKPPRPRPSGQRPILLKSKTIDCPTPPEPRTNSIYPQQRPLEAGSKIPSLDSLYEQLKAFAASPENNAPPRVDANLAADLAALVGGVARSRSASYSGASLSVRNQPKVFLAWPMHLEFFLSFVCALMGKCLPVVPQPNAISAPTSRPPMLTPTLTLTLTMIFLPPRRISLLAFTFGPAVLMFIFVNHTDTTGHSHFAFVTARLKKLGIVNANVNIPLR